LWATAEEDTTAEPGAWPIVEIKAADRQYAVGAAACPTAGPPHRLPILVEHGRVRLTAHRAAGNRMAAVDKRAGAVEKRAVAVVDRTVAATRSKQ